MDKVWGGGICHIALRSVPSFFCVIVSLLHSGGLHGAEDGLRKEYAADPGSWYVNFSTADPDTAACSSGNEEFYPSANTMEYGHQVI